MRPIRVPLKGQSYAIHFGSYRSRFLKELKKLRLKPSRVLVVTTRSVAKAGHANRILRLLRKSGHRSSLEVLPNGESAKSMDSLVRLYRKSLQLGLDRRSLIVALGGGVITDLAGFLGASYMRGISLISIPTTLLGMVDAAIGGKTGVDLKEGKNLVGAFWQPKMVWVDPQFLKTLPRREWRTGFAEIIKYGVIMNARFFHWLEKKLKNNARVDLWRESDLVKAIRVSAQMNPMCEQRRERNPGKRGPRNLEFWSHHWACARSRHAIPKNDAWRSH